MTFGIIRIGLIQPVTSHVKLEREPPMDCGKLRCTGQRYGQKGESGSGTEIFDLSKFR